MAQVDRLFRRSGLMRGKWDEPRGEATYGRQTLDKAAPGEVYRPRPRIRSGGRKGGGGERQAVGGAPAELDELNLTDRGNAERLARAHGRDLRWVKDWEKGWLRYDGRRWARSTTEEVLGLGAAVIRALIDQTRDEIAAVKKDRAQTEEEKREKKAELARLKRQLGWFIKSEMAARLNAMPHLLKSEPGLLVESTRLDRAPWALNTPDGTLDLRTGQLRPHDRGDYLTSLCPTPYRPDADCPLWKRFLEQVFAGYDGRPDYDLIDYVQKLLGYCLTGDVSAHLLPVFWGQGGNGKGTLLNTVLHVLGPDYAGPANADFLLARKGERHPTEVADLFGRRLVSCQETAEGASLNEPLVKWLTGGDPLKARRMREDYWSFFPTHKLVLSTNHKPTIRGSDGGIWRRLRLVPFTRTVMGEKEDRSLPERLKAEAEGILAWLVRGGLAWRTEGECPPDAVLLATKEYREEQDKVGQFLDERCELADGARTAAAALYAAFTSRCEANGDRFVMSQTAFGSRLSQKGLAKVRSGGISREGVRLRLSNPFKGQAGGGS